jgi:glutamyl-tRNA synthetase
VPVGVKVRFAPSPTGYLHVGNARIALVNALLARHAGGRFLLRLDDTDTARSRPEYEAAIKTDLAWLGLTWDECVRQSDRLDRYALAAERLKAAGRLYPCFESEEELRAKREARLKRGAAPVYDRAMLRLTPEQRTAAEAGGKRPYWRFLLSPATRSWDDLVLGRREVRLATLSDPVLIRADGTPLYTFTSVVDDIETGVTHVIRGEDHVTNTAVQLDLWEALGARPQAVAFAHLPLLVDSDGGKLSKRLEGLSLRSLRHDGLEPAALVAYLARLGTSAAPELLPLPELAAGFDLAQVSRSPARFDMRQLLALNRRVLQSEPFEAVRDRLPPGADARFWTVVRGNLDLLSEAREWWEVVAGEISPPAMPEERAFLRAALAALPPEPWDETSWADWTARLKAATGREGRALFRPLRLALTGEERGPEMRDLLPMIGPARAAERLRRAAL